MRQLQQTELFPVQSLPTHAQALALHLLAAGDALDDLLAPSTATNEAARQGAVATRRLACLGEMLWESQRSGRPPDGNAYIAAVQRRATRD